jgi:N-acetylglucosamine-6-sulfatase
MRPGQGPRAPAGARRNEPKDGGVSKSGLQLLGIALAALALALLPALPAEFWGPVRPSRPALASAGPMQPNIIVIQTDDQDPASLAPDVMPNVLRDIASRGTRFTDYIDSGPLCCPSRAVMLTGQYGHNNGVMWNNPAYADLREKDNTLPVWLQQAGYVTAHLGKYLNLYGLATGDPNQVAPGWDQWDTVLEPGGGLHPLAPTPYYNYVLRVNGHPVRYGSAPSDYLTNVLNSKAVALIHHELPGPRPLFMEVDQAAPHVGANTDPRCHGAALPAPPDLHAFVDKPLRTPPSFNEADVSDKPRFVRIQPRLSPQAIGNQRRVQDCRLASLLAVDRGVGQIVNALTEEHQLGNTAIIYTSDNGFLLGEHRLVGKIDPYEADLRVPFVVRLPQRFLGPEGAPPHLGNLVANVDIAPTILSLAGAQPCTGAGDCRVLDGRSLLPAIQSDGANWPPDRAIPLELKTSLVHSGPVMPCVFQGVQARDQVLVEYHSVNMGSGCAPDHEIENYDLRSDPSELENLYPAPSGSAESRLQQSLRAEVAELSDCSGIPGRDPEPPSGHYCR